MDKRFHVKVLAFSFFINSLNGQLLLIVLTSVLVRKIYSVNPGDIYQAFMFCQ